MQVKKHVRERIFKPIKYILIYLVCFAILWGVFGYAYMKMGMWRPYFTSMGVLLGIDIQGMFVSKETVSSGVMTNVIEAAKGISDNVLPGLKQEVFLVVEKFIKLIMDIFFAAKLVSLMLIPGNPVIFAKRAVYDPLKQSFLFRYWVILRKKHFLHSAEINVFLANRNEFNKGINSINKLWDWRSEIKDPSKPNVQLGMIRGERYIEIESPYAQTLAEKINENANSQGLRLYVSITAKDDSGRIFFHQIEYGIPDVLYACAFVPISENDVYAHEQLKKVAWVCSDELNKVMSKENIKYINYHHFDKFYKIEDSYIQEEILQGVKQKLWDDAGLKKNLGKTPHTCTAKYMLSGVDIIFGKERGIRRWIINFNNELIWYIYVWDRTWANYWEHIAGKLRFKKEWKKII